MAPPRAPGPCAPKCACACPPIATAGTGGNAGARRSAATATGGAEGLAAPTRTTRCWHMANGHCHACARDGMGATLALVAVRICMRARRPMPRPACMQASARRPTACACCSNVSMAPAAAELVAVRRGLGFVCVRAHGRRPGLRPGAGGPLPVSHGRGIFAPPAVLRGIWSLRGGPFHFRTCWRHQLYVNSNRAHGWSHMAAAVPQLEQYQLILHQLDLSAVTRLSEVSKHSQFPVQEQLVHGFDCLVNSSS